MASAAISDFVAQQRRIFSREEMLAPRNDDAAKLLNEASLPVLQASLAALESLAEWTAAGIEAALRQALIEGLGLKPKVAFGALRVAVTGRRVSPPLFESLELLGRESSLGRIRSAIGQ